jgi:hypothetical protein
MTPLFGQTPIPVKIDAALAAVITKYSVSIIALGIEEEKLEKNYGAIEKYTQLIDSQRKKERGREIFAAAYLELNTLYAQRLITGLKLIIKNNKALGVLKIIPMVPSLGKAESRIEYLEDQIKLIQLFGLLLFKKTHERGKVLMIATVLINKMTRVIIELSERLYDIKVTYTILRAAIYTIAKKDDLLIGLEANFFGFDYVLQKFQKEVENGNEE